MAIICPTVLAEEPHAYREQMERIAGFAERVQIDLADGIFAPVRTILPHQIWWPHSIHADIHCMYGEPLKWLDQLIKLEPHMIIVHAEADGLFDAVADKLEAAGIKVGIALLSETAVSTILPVTDRLEHVLIFAGKLGSFGGSPDIDKFADKVHEVRSKLGHVEIGWDGGISDENAEELIALGVDVLNVGGYIQQAESPASAYATLKSLAEKNR